MIKFPPDFVKIKYPGYFWNVTEKKLYSIKVSGELVPLTFHKGFSGYGQVIPPGYRVSVKGRRKNIPLDYLMALTVPADEEIIDVKKDVT